MLERTDPSVQILMVDDREDNLVALEAILQNSENYNLVKARSGQEALDQLPGHDFAMILLDVQMPGLDGFQTAELIRRQPRFRSIPILFVTAINKDDRYVYRGFEVGAVDYIFKPFDPIILRSKVAVFADLHLKSRKIRQQARDLAEREVLAHRAKMQEMEIESLRRYRRLADAIPHIILRMPGGPDTLEYNNARWTHSTGQNPSESAGNGWQKAIDPRDLPGLLMAWNKAAVEACDFEQEVRVYMRDGSLRWHWFKVERENESLTRTIWLITGTDIQDRKSVEDDLQEARRNADAANEAKTHFLANMSHEIRTPLSAIMGFSELILDVKISDSHRTECASIIRRNGTQLLRIVDEILDISKVESGGLEIEHVEVRLPHLLDEVKTVLQVEASKKKLELLFECESQLPERVITDPTRLKQILLNIAGNAIKFTEKGWVKINARSAGDGDPHFIRIEISDSGIGIDSGSAEKIFEPFSQAESSTTRLYGGTGLGLALSRRLARALGGDVRLLESRPGAGSRFEVLLRVGLSTRKRDALTHDSKPAMSFAPRPELSGKRVLLVEDVEDNQTLIARILQANGVELDMATNGQEGIAKALAGDYHAVLMDIQMPLLDGYQATSRLRKAGYTRPIIALTAYALPEERERSLNHGCTTHLTKPINRRELIESLIEVMAEAEPPSRQLDA